VSKTTLRQDIEALAKHWNNVAEMCRVAGKKDASSVYAACAFVLQTRLNEKRSKSKS
jgi:hypothetical protein